MLKTQENKFGKPVISPNKTMQKTYQHTKPTKQQLFIPKQNLDLVSQGGSTVGQGMINPTYHSGGNSNGNMSGTGFSKSPQNNMCYD